jgi:hypothetical protein
MSEAENDMVDGYRDGRQRDSMEPGQNRSEAYRFGFANGRDDLTKNPRAPAEILRAEAERILA